MTTHTCPVGLVENRLNIPFKCGTCNFYRGKSQFYRGEAPTAGACKNPHPDLNGRNVQARWCCNLYKHQDMKTIVA